MGAVWFDQPVDVEGGFFTTFSFSVTKVVNAGGNGFAFVLQDSGPYTIGRGRDGLGYDGLGHGVAVEFDMVASPPSVGAAHVSLHAGLFESKLSSKEDAPASYRKLVPGLATYDEDPANAQQHRFVTIEYTAAEGVLTVSESHRDSKGKFVLTDLLRVQLGAVRGKFHVGFTAATSEGGASGFSRMAIRSWYLDTRGSGGNGEGGAAAAAAAAAAGEARLVCSDGFTGADCSVTNEVASRECPRRLACNTCVEDVYNCAWCGGPNKCVVGVVEELKECQAVLLEPLACRAGLSRVWLYLLGVAFVVVLAFGLVLFKVLPARQSFRAISLLVALVGGALSGMAFSFVVSVSLVEISETSFFAVAYGLFFLLQSATIAGHVYREELPARGWDSHSALLAGCALAALVSAVACFLLDRRLIHWLPETPKVLLYTVLGATLNFCLVFSAAEISGEIAHRCSASEQSHIASSVERGGARDSQAKGGAAARGAIMRSHARVALLVAASLISGTFFGFMFGTLRIEEEAIYRVALALQQEAAYTYPVGALLGGVSAMLYQLLQLPLASDDQIDNILRHGGDDL